MFHLHLRRRSAAQLPTSLRGFSRSTCWQVSSLAVFSVLAVAGYAPAARAQTAHFGGVLQTLSSGFTSPFGVAVDASGNVYVADTYNNAIKEIVAVNGSIPANPTINTLSSSFNQPRGVAVDASGNVYVADSGNNAVKEIVAVSGSIPASPTITTLSSGFNLPFGVAVDASGNVFVADTANNAIKEIVAVNGSIPANPTTNTLGSGFSSPTGVAVDASGDVYVADFNNSAVKEILAVGGSIPASPTINTLGSGFNQPTSVAVDASGNAYVTINSSSAIKEMVAVGGSIPASPTILTLGNGFNNPNGVAVDAGGDVFVADSNNNAIKEVSPAKFGSVAVGTSSAQQSLTFNFDGSGALAATPYAVLTQGAANLDFQAAGSQPSSVCVTGHTYNLGDTCTVNVTFTPAHPGQRMGAVQLMGSGGAPIATGFARGIGTGPQVIFPSNNTLVGLGSGFDAPFGLAVDASGDIFVADNGNNAIKEIVAVNGSIPANPTIKTLSSSFSGPRGVALDGSGDVYVADTGNSAVKEIVAVNGSIPANPTILTLGSGFSFPTGVAVDASGDVYVADVTRNAIKEVVAVSGSIPASPTIKTWSSSFSQPRGVAVDASGNVYVADTGNNAIKEIVAVNGSIPASSPTILTLGSGFNSPWGLAVDETGDVFVDDSGNNAVKEIVAVNGSIPANPTINTLGSEFNFPTGVAVDASGNVFVPNGSNNLINELPYATAPSLSFAATTVGLTSSDSPQTVTVANDGNANLSFTVPATGLNPAFSSMNFTLGGSSTCPQLDSTSAAGTLASGLSCTYLVSFSPMSGDSMGGTLAITDNTLNANPGATQTVNLSGSAILETQTITFPQPSSPVVYGAAPVTLAATASSGLPVTYTVTGPATVSGSTLTFTGAGTVVVTASQSGDASYSPATPVSDTIVVTPPTPPGFTMTASPTSMTTQFGVSAFTLLQLTPVGGYNGTVALSCANLPAHAACQFALGSVTLNGTNPVSVGLVIQTNAAYGQARLVAPSMPTPPNPILPALAFGWPGGLAGLAAFGIKRKLSKTRRRWLHLGLLLAMSGALALGLAGCGSKTSQTTTITVTATPTSGTGISPQSVTLNLTIAGS